MGTGPTAGTASKALRKLRGQRTALPTSGPALRRSTKAATADPAGGKLRQWGDRQGQIFGEQVS
ncbi:MAG: hypothetical protein ACO3FE_15940 [Planctomycetaceae bacterium]